MTDNYDYLRSIIGGRVRRLGLLVWPDANGLRNTDVQLHMGIDCVDGVHREITCRTDSDGQTLKVESEHWPRGLPLSKIDERKMIWRSPEFWDCTGDRAYELFETAEERSYGIGQGSIVTAVHFITFVDDPTEATGIVLEFDSKTRLWSAPAAHGNRVSLSSEDFVWPTEVALIPLTRWPKQGSVEDSGEFSG